MNVVEKQLRKESLGSRAGFEAAKLASLLDLKGQHGEAQELLQERLSGCLKSTAGRGAAGSQPRQVFMCLAKWNEVRGMP